MPRFQLLLVLPLVTSLLRADEPKQLPLPGENFTIQERPAFVIPPSAKRQGPTPWVLYAPTLPGLPSAAEKWMFERWSAQGIAIAGIDVGESYGSPAGRALYSALYQELVERRGFARKLVLLGRSRGGLMTLGWGVENSDRIAAFAGIYPVCDLQSYPGLERAAGAYGMTPDELRDRLAEHNPVLRLDALAAARIPLFAIHGDEDRVVPLEKNSGAVRDRYQALGAPMRLVVPQGQGHNMWPGFFQSQELVDFVAAEATRHLPKSDDSR